MHFLFLAMPANFQLPPLPPFFPFLKQSHRFLFCYSMIRQNKITTVEVEQSLGRGILLGLCLTRITTYLNPSRAKQGLMVYGVRILWFDGGNLRTGSTNHGQTFRK